MATQRTDELADEGDSAESEGQLRDWLGFAVRAPQRHRVLFFTTLVVALCLAIAAAAVVPRVYEVSVKILAQRPLVLTSLVNPNRPISGEAESPTRGVQDMILRRDSVVAMIKGTNLLDIWESQRPPILKLKDRIQRSISGTPSDEDRLSALVGTLQTKLNVQVDDQTIKIALQWENPQTAFQIVSVAVKNFFEDRSAAELAVLGETIAILDDELKKQSEVVEADLLEVRRLKAKSDAASGVATTAPPTPGNANPTTPPPTTTNETAPPPSTGPTLAEKLAEKRSEIKALDEPRQRKLRDLYEQLADLKSKYADANPLVIAKEQQIKEASVDPPELAKLKSEEQALLEDQDDAPVKTNAVAPSGQPKAKPSTNSAPLLPSQQKDEDPDLAQARAKLIAATRKYQELSDRISSARIEIISAQAAFKYRYTIVQPPELPKKPIKPNVPVLFAGGTIFALLLAIGAAMARDLLSGRVIEAWQLQRRLKLPVLAQVHVEK